MRLPETRYARTDDGIHIGYQVHGDGPFDLVVIDGWLGNLDANWDLPPYRDFLEELGRHARILNFDRRGFGVSDRPTSLESLLLEKGLDDVRAVMSAAGVDRALFYGFESGAALALLFAASFPDRVQGLVLGAPLVAYQRTPDFPFGWDEALISDWDERLRDRWGTVEFWRENMRDMNLDADDDELAAWARWSRLAASPAAALAVEQVERHVDVRALLPQIVTPTLVAMKESDRDGVWGAAPWVAERIPGARYVEIPGTGHMIFSSDKMFFDELDAFARGIGEEQAVFDRVLATVLFTDIVESTQHAVELGDRAWKDALQRHHQTVRSVLARYRGVEIDTAGDGFFATFDGPARAVRAAQQIISGLGPLGLEVRAGVHTGEVQMIDGKAGGLGVVIGARIGALAGASEVLVSQTVRDLVAGSGLVFEDRGARQLKGVPDEWRLYAAVS
jgi:class 3 adenylate cyclase/pimeloyl-ACP methyl ester carboxylesterase